MASGDYAGDAGTSRGDGQPVAAAVSTASGAGAKASALAGGTNMERAPHDLDAYMEAMLEDDIVEERTGPKTSPIDHDSDGGDDGDRERDGEALEENLPPLSASGAWPEMNQNGLSHRHIGDNEIDDVEGETAMARRSHQGHSDI